MKFVFGLRARFGWSYSIRTKVLYRTLDELILLCNWTLVAFAFFWLSICVVSFWLLPYTLIPSSFKLLFHIVYSKESRIMHELDSLNRVHICFPFAYSSSLLWIVVIYVSHHRVYSIWILTQSSCSHFLNLVHVMLFDLFLEHSASGRCGRTWVKIVQSRS